MIGAPMEPTSRPEPPPLPPHYFQQKLAKNKNEWLKLVLAVMIGLGVPAAYYSITQYQKEQKNKILQAAQAAYEKQRPHDEIKAAIENLRKNGKDLPACPLIFPLLDKNKHLTNLGSYISYMAMLQASLLPESVLSLPNIGKEYQNYALFEPDHFDIQKTYRKGLPMDIQAKDLAEGTWVKNKKGYKISIHLWGTRPEKKSKNNLTTKAFIWFPTGSRPQFMTG